MNKKYFFYLWRTASTPEGQEKLLVVPSKTATEASLGLHQRLQELPQPAFTAALGWVSHDALAEAITPASGLENPVQVISAVDYIAETYPHVLSPRDYGDLKRIKTKLVKDFFG